MCNPFVPLAHSFEHQCLIWSADGYYFQPISFQLSSSTTRATISPPVTRVGAWSSSNEINRSVGSSLVMLEPLCAYYPVLTLRSASPVTLLRLVRPASFPAAQSHHTSLQTYQIISIALMSSEKGLRIQVLYRIPIT